jgi:hypothetical protein
MSICIVFAPRVFVSCPHFGQGRLVGLAAIGIDFFRSAIFSFLVHTIALKTVSSSVAFAPKVLGVTGLPWCSRLGLRDSFIERRKALVRRMINKLDHGRRKEGQPRFISAVKFSGDMASDRISMATGGAITLTSVSSIR